VSTDAGADAPENTVLADQNVTVPAPGGWVRRSQLKLQSTGLQAALGFAFWVVAARLFSAHDVGQATSLLSAATVIAYIAQIGLNSTVIRYLPTTKSRDVLITVSLALVGSLGMIVAVAYVFALPIIAPQLRFLEHNVLFALGFVLLSGAAAINLFTDSIFIASRRTGVNAVVDGGVGGVSKLLLIGVLAGSGTYGLFCASVGGFAAAALASVVLSWTLLHYRPEFKGALDTMRPLLRFSGANYLGNVFNLLPTLVVTLIVLDRLGAQAAGYYFIAFQFANLLYAGSYAVEANFLAEGAHGEERLTTLMWRSGKVLIYLAVPAALAGTLLAHWIMLVFGGQYAAHGSDALMIMALGTIPVSAQNWLVTVLRLSGQLAAITVCNVVYAVAICGLAWILAPHGLTPVGAAWLLGPAIGAVAALVAVLWGVHRGPLVLANTVRLNQTALEDATPLSVATTTAYREEYLPEEEVDSVTDQPAGTDAVADDSEEQLEPVSEGGRRWWPFVAVAAVILLGASLISPAGRHQWDISIFRQPTHYTTLSFERAATLPESVNAEKTVNLLFSVGNNEGRRVDYLYRVTSANSDGSDVKVLEHGKVAVPSGGAQSVEIIATPVCTTSSCRLAITLPAQKETIDVLVKTNGVTK
jgi:O-antigen/teichoic acid export membrane protein